MDFIDDNLAFEQTIVSDHIHQFLTDYLFVCHKLTAEGLDIYTDMGGDIALSIVNDSYRQMHQKQSEEQPIGNNS